MLIGYSTGRKASLTLVLTNNWLDLTLEVGLRGVLSFEQVVHDLSDE